MKNKNEKPQRGEMSDKGKIGKDEEIIYDITRRHIAGNFAAKHWIEKAVRESKQYFEKQARAEVIEEVKDALFDKISACREVTSEGIRDSFLWLNEIEQVLTKLSEAK